MPNDFDDSCKWLTNVRSSAWHLQRSHKITYIEHFMKVARSSDTTELPILSSFQPNNIIYYKHNAELQRAGPGTKDMGYFSTRGSIFPHDAQNEFSLFSWF